MERAGNWTACGQVRGVAAAALRWCEIAGPSSTRPRTRIVRRSRLSPSPSPGHPNQRCGLRSSKGMFAAPFFCGVCASHSRSFPSFGFGRFSVCPAQRKVRTAPSSCVTYLASRSQIKKHQQSQRPINPLGTKGLPHCLRAPPSECWPTTSAGLPRVSLTSRHEALFRSRVARGCRLGAGELGYATFLCLFFA